MRFVVGLVMVPAKPGHIQRPIIAIVMGFGFRITAHLARLLFQKAKAQSVLNCQMAEILFRVFFPPRLLPCQALFAIVV